MCACASLHTHMPLLMVSDCTISQCANKGHGGGRHACWIEGFKIIQPCKGFPEGGNACSALVRAWGQIQCISVGNSECKQRFCWFTQVHNALRGKGQSSCIYISLWCWHYPLWWKRSNAIYWSSLLRCEKHTEWVHISGDTSLNSLRNGSNRWQHDCSLTC